MMSAVEKAVVEAPDQTVDVAILGGGLAGLTLAMQLSQGDPTLSIVVFERATHPVPEAAHKVGESTVEIGAHYLRDVLNLGSHLQEQQLNKFGLRIFFTEADNSDISRRREFGHAVAPPQRVGTFQVDRGRLENALGELVGNLDNVSFLSGTRVIGVRSAGATGHEVTVESGGRPRRISARWVVDSTGRAGFLKKDRELAEESRHHANAVWLRVAAQVDVDDWSESREWHDRILECRRRLSTNHLMGRGYWVWLIPLSSGATSIGIVTDPDCHPFATLNTIEKALEWLSRFEPQCATAIRQNIDQILDFRVMRDYARGATQLFSAQRWCLTGDAGIFLDPLYSPGMDLIAIANGLIADLIHRDIAGEEITELSAIHNHVLKLVTDGWLDVYTGHLPTMGNARVMTAKVVWDTAAYWAVLGLLYFHDAFRNLVDYPEMVADLARFSVSSRALQVFFREWAAVNPAVDGDAFLSFYDFNFMAPLHTGMTQEHTESELSVRFRENIDFLDFLSGQLISIVLDECSQPGATAEMRKQANAWRANPSLMALAEASVQNSAAPTVDTGWITGKKPTAQAGHP